MKIAVAGATGAVGTHVVEVARARGHEVVALSRSAGVDLTSTSTNTNTNTSTNTNTNIAARLDGAHAVIDVTSVQTQSAAASVEFFSTVTANLLAAGQAAGVGHHLALSIVGSDLAPFGYYAGKAAQEALVSEGRIPWTILRATQFHEFAGQIGERFHLGPIGLVPRMLSQPVAAREVAARLVGLAEAGPSEAARRPADLAGPEVLRMAGMVRALRRATGVTGPVVELPLPGGFGRAMRDGTTLAGPAADRGVQTFAEWVAERATAPRDRRPGAHHRPQER